MRKVFMGLWSLSGVSLPALILAGYPLLGVGAFALFGLGALVSFRRYDGPCLMREMREDWRKPAREHSE